MGGNKHDVDVMEVAPKSLTVEMPVVTLCKAIVTGILDKAPDDLSKEDLDALSELQSVIHTALAKSA